jgi:UDP-glucose 4-epimerase
MKQKIFITGVAGFLGSHLADAMLKAGHEVSGCDNLIERIFGKRHGRCRNQQ